MRRKRLDIAHRTVLTTSYSRTHRDGDVSCSSAVCSAASFGTGSVHSQGLQRRDNPIPVANSWVKRLAFSPAFQDGGSSSAAA